jgi:hypothetical protein
MMYTKLRVYNDILTRSWIYFKSLYSIVYPVLSVGLLMAGKLFLIL